MYILGKDENLKHYGVPGMKWGIRRYQPYPKGKGHKGKFLGKVKRAVSNSRIAQNIRSRSREGKAYLSKKNLDKMSTREIQEKARRMQLENDMKSLARTRKEKKDYRNRGNMSDQELLRKVDRLRAKELYNQNANKAGEDFRKAGQRVAKTATDLSIRYQMNKGDLSTKDLYDSIMNPTSARQHLNNYTREKFINNKEIQSALKTVFKKK